MKIAHISDIHFNFDISPFHIQEIKVFLGYLNYKIRRKRKFPDQIARNLISFLSRSKIELIIFSGDITNFSYRKEFAQAKQQMFPLLKENFFMIPGNHDRYTNKSSFEYEKFFQEFSGQPIDKNFYIYIKKMKNFCLVGLDSSRPNPILDASGYLPSQSIFNLIGYLKKNCIKNYILISHHPLLNPKYKVETNKHKMINREEIVSLLKSYPPKLYLHGHQHINWIRKKDEEIPFTVVNSASSTYQPDKTHRTGFHLIDLNADLTKIFFDRYEYCLKKNIFEKKDPIYFKEFEK